MWLEVKKEYRRQKQSFKEKMCCVEIPTCLYFSIIIYHSSQKYVDIIIHYNKIITTIGTTKTNIVILMINT